MKKILAIAVLALICSYINAQNRNASVIEDLCEQYYYNVGMKYAVKGFESFIDDSKYKAVVAYRNGDKSTCWLEMAAVKAGEECLYGSRAEELREFRNFKEYEMERFIGEFYVAGSNHPEYLKAKDSIYIGMIGSEIVMAYKYNGSIDYDSPNLRAQMRLLKRDYKRLFK